MRELDSREIGQVAGGYQGTKIPFFSAFTPGESFRGKPTGVIGAAMAGWEIGTAIGKGVNNFNDTFSRMSLGVAVYRTFNGSSSVLGGGGGNPIRIPVTRVEEM